MLHLVPTPIGNLKDITLRALEILQDADVILAEDTRKSGKLLSHYDIKTPMESFHMHNEHKKVTSVIERLKKGISFAMISDAGTPGISDPGFLLTRACYEEGLKIECLPGATALIPALVKSGFPSDRFIFEGFLPHKKGKQKRILALVEETRTIIFYESPHRLVKTLVQLAEHFGADRLASVSREITKLHEETFNGTLAEIATYFEQKGVKGEIVIVVKGK